MPIKSIEKIRIGNYPEGKFANGYIYSAQINQGYSENTNKLTIDIVYQQGENIVLPEKNLTTSYRIEFGDLIFPQMYFISHTKNVGVNEEIISCTFVDGSILLDRYYVGLTNRHYRINEQNSVFNINVICANCDNTIGIQNGNVNRAVATSPNLVVNNLIVVGDEEFVDQSCDVPDVKYNFTDLLSAMAKIPNFSFRNFLDINPSYKTSYTGTLREVLSNWCSDFGFSFYWDFISNALICIDLRNPVDLTPVSNYITSNFNQGNTSNNLPISNFTEEESLEGTYQQDNIDYVLKPSRTKERPFVDFFPISYSCLKINDAFFRETTRYGINQFKIGCILSKYNQQLRTLYHLNYGNFELIGFQSIYAGIEKSVLENVLKNIYEFDPDFIRIGFYSEDNDRANAEKEAAIANDFIGRYYYNDNYVAWKNLYCNDSARFTLSTTAVPDSDCTRPQPWKSYGGSYTPPITSNTQVNCLFTRGSATYEEYNVENFSIENLGPIYTYIAGEVADQVRNELLKINPNDTNADRYRGMTLIAFKGGLSVVSVPNEYNNSEEGITPAQYESDETLGCSTVCEKDSGTEICSKICTRLSSPAFGLVSKFSEGLVISNKLNGSSMKIIFPSEQNYLGYIKAEGSLFYTEFGVKAMNLTSDSNFAVNSNVMQYNINLNDITTEDPSVGTINIKSIPQNSDELSIVQKNTRKSISLKVIGMNYGLLNNYLNPEAGLTSLNVYLNDNGVFTDLTFENRPAQKPKGEVVMQKVGPQKIRVIK